MNDRQRDARGFSRRTFWRAAGLGTAILSFQLNTSATLASAAEGKPPLRGPAQRKRPLLDHWLFGGPIPVDQRPGKVPDAELDTVHLPHTVVDLPTYNWDPTSWEHNWLYRRYFDLPEQRRGFRHFLRFEGAMTGATPYVNGRALSQHLGGYLPFEYEITQMARTKNMLDVVLDGRADRRVPPNHGPGSPTSAVDYWQPAGLYREVSVNSVPPNFLADVFAEPENVLNADSRRVRVRCQLDVGVTPRDARLTVELRDKDNTITTKSVDVVELPPGQHTVELTLEKLEDVQLWSLDSPKLYEVVATLYEQGNPVHDYRDRIGFREARFEKWGFYLNGERIQLFGLNRHQIYPYEGHAASARMQRKEAETLRNDLNCNMVRCSHYPQHQAFLDACDELGMLVWDEAPGWQYLGTGEWLRNCYRDVGDMIIRGRNHPSIVLWGARLNETPGNAAFYTSTQQLAKSLDDSRQTTGAILGADHETTDFQQDVFGYNDYSASVGPDGLMRPELAPPRTDYPYLVTECVGTLSGPAIYYRRTDPQSVQQGQALAHARAHDLARRSRNYAGVLAWGAFDYPSGHGNIYQGVKWIGVVDRYRVAKPGAAVYRAQIDPRRRPVIEPSFYWDFDPKSPVTDLGNRAAIWSNLDRLELFVDDEPFASLRPARGEFPRLPHPPFFADFSKVDGSRSPRLRVDGYLDDRRVLTREYSSDRAHDQLVLEMDDPQLLPDGADSTRAEIRAVDAFGANRPYVAGDVRLQLTGPAVLIGDNPFPLEALGGAGAVWIRSVPNRAGDVRLTATHPVLGTAEAHVIVGGTQR